MTRRTGFTLVELSLATAFISILSLAVVLIIAGAVSSYHKSITLNRVDQVGSEIVGDMTTAVQAGPSRAITNLCIDVYTGSSQNTCISNFGNMVSVTRKATVSKGGTSIGEVPVFGAFCTGAYSYVWNSGYYFNDGYRVGNGSVGPAKVSYVLKNSGAQQRDRVPRLMKIIDENRAVCVAAMKLRGKSGGGVNVSSNNYDPKDMDGTFDLTVAGIIKAGEKIELEEEPEELLSNTEDGGLALYDLNATVAMQKDAARNVFYYASFILGTVQGGVNISGTGNFCEPPEGYNNSELENFNYCAINKFNFAAVANGG
ncbi:hypothetical protein IKG60_01990 [Candidatus Saccharibacteria bacterium]|nr:hypothetical protein [Candidatus Saccharibacteria bacterium]